MQNPRLLGRIGRLPFALTLLLIAIPTRDVAANPNGDAAACEVETPLVRVGLMRCTGATSLRLSADPGARLLGYNSTEVDAGPGPWRVAVVSGAIQILNAGGRALGAPSSNWRLECDDAETRLAISTKSGRPRHYHGSLLLQIQNGRLSVVNEVSIEDYLRGVLNGEMGADAPFEALKAQAIAARSYSFASRGRWMNLGYDLRDNTDSQLYGGVEAERAATDRAVRETAGTILISNGVPLWASYSTDCGGVTAPGASPDDCPKSVSDEDAHAHAPNARFHTWQLRLTPARLAERLPASARAPGTLVGIAVVETDVSGRAKRVRLAWGHAMPVVPATPPAPDLPNDPNSTDPDQPPGTPPAAPAAADSASINASRAELPADAVVREIGGNALRVALGVDELRSTLFKVHREPNGDFVFDGKGWGHGRGLCQRGAIAMAAAGMGDYKAILARYYSGASIGSIVYREAEGDPPGDAAIAANSTDTREARAASSPFRK